MKTVLLLIGVVLCTASDTTSPATSTDHPHSSAAPPSSSPVQHGAKNAPVVPASNPVKPNQPAHPDAPAVPHESAQSAPVAPPNAPDKVHDNAHENAKTSHIHTVPKAPATHLPHDHYTTKFDNVNVEDIIKNERLYQKYFDCLVHKGNCAPDAKHLKEIIPDALKSGCSKCNDQQKQKTEAVIKFIIEKHPQDFEALEKIYDPDSVYKKRYAEEAEKHGLKLHEEKHTSHKIPSV